MIKKALKKEFSSSVKGALYFDKPLKEYTSFNIGGKAVAWIEPVDPDDLRNTLRTCRELKLPVFLLGSGTNLLIDDASIKKVAISLSASLFKKIEFNRNSVICGSGVLMSNLIRASQEKGLGGLEFLAGVPGTVGGAVLMNAGGAKKATGDFVKWLKVMDCRGNIKEITAEEISFGYRRSGLSGKIVLEAAFKLRKSDPKILKERFQTFLNKKIRTQELSYPNAGCIFKNPDCFEKSTGELLESVDLKGMRIGGAQFSKIHANFIVNLGGATFRDVRRLIKLAQRRVKKRYNLWLEPEIKIVN